MVYKQIQAENANLMILTIFHNHQLGVERVVVQIAKLVGVALLLHSFPEQVRLSI
jgi:hypothetical protein